MHSIYASYRKDQFQNVAKPQLFLVLCNVIQGSWKVKTSHYSRVYVVLLQFVMIFFQFSLHSTSILRPDLHHHLHSQLHLFPLLSCLLVSRPLLAPLSPRKLPFFSLKFSSLFDSRFYLLTRHTWKVFSLVLEQ